MSPVRKSKKELLRQRAEKLLSKKSLLVSKIENRDIKKLVHELQVHQIELEMQNEELRKSQEAIEESRTKYSDLYDFAPVGYFTFSQVGEIVEVNLTGASLLGIDRTKLLQRSFSAFVDPEFRAVFRDHRLNVLKSGEKERCELKLIKKDGKSFYTSLESISVSHGRNHRIRSAVSDITELKKAQEKAETEHEFRIAVENSILSGIMAVDLEGRQSYVNIGFCRMVGRSEEELIGRKPPFAYWPPEEMDHISNVFQTATDGKAPREGIQLRFMRKNGERFDALVLPSPLKDHRGKFIGWVATIGDITHFKQMEKELKQLNIQLEERVRQRTAELETANQQLRQEITERKRLEESFRYLATFPEINPNPIMEVDMAGTFHYLNPAAKELFPDLIASGMQHPSLAGFESLAATLKEKTKGSLGREVKIDNRWYDQALFRVPDMDRIRIYSRDITKRKQMEEELRKSRDELEIRVQERTGELMDVVEELQDEMSERKRIEEALIEQSRILEGFFTSTITPLVLLDKHFNFIRVNEAYAKVCQRDISEFPRHNHFEFYPHEENEAIFKRVVETKAHYQAFAKPFTFPDHPEWGTTYWDWTLTPLSNDKGEVEFLVFSLEDVTRQGQAEEALRESEARLRYLSSQLLAVQENERKNIAREVHDSLGQSLSAIKFKVESVITEMRESRHEEIAKSLETVVPIIQTSIEESRRIQMDLRPSVLDDLGIVPTLEWFCRDYQKIYSHIRIEKETHIKESDLSPELKTVIYRVTQEAMNNIAKHSKANLVRLSLNKNENKIELTIRDNGIGFDLEQVIDREESKRGLGLTSMRERIQLSGGSFVIESTLRQGTTLTAIWTI